MSKIVMQVIAAQENQPAVVHLSFAVSTLRHVPRVRHKPAIDVTIKAERINNDTYVGVWGRRVLIGSKAPKGFVRVLTPGPTPFALFDSHNLPNGTATTLADVFEYASRAGLANIELQAGPSTVPLNKPEPDLLLMGWALVDAAALPEPLAVVPELDVAGVPWDSRIHSRSKTKTGRGTWVRRKAVSDIYYATVLSQIATVPVPIESGSTVLIQVGSETYTFTDLTATQLREVMLVLNAKN